MRPIDYFDRGATISGDGVFLEGAGKTFTFAETRRLTQDISNSLCASGLEQGDSVAVFSPNDPQAVVCIQAVFRSGGAWIPVNVRNATSTNAQYMAYVDTRWLLFHSAVIDAVEEIVPQLDGLKGIICMDSSETPYP